MMIRKKKKQNLLLSLSLGETLQLLKNEEIPESPSIPPFSSFSSITESGCYNNTQITYFLNSVKPGSFPNFPVNELSQKNSICSHWVPIRELIEKCCANYSFVHPIFKDILHRKKLMLLDILSFLKDRGKLKKPEIKDVFVLLKYNLFRNFAPPIDEGYLDYNEKIKDIAWSHLLTVYQIFKEILHTSNRSDVSHHLTPNFLTQFIYLLQTQDESEKAEIRIILSTIYNFHQPLKVVLEDMIINLLTSYVYDQFEFNGIVDVIIICQTFPYPTFKHINERYRNFIFKVLIPLHGHANLMDFLDEIIHLIVTIVQTDTTYAAMFVNKLCKYWKSSSIVINSGFIAEFGEILEHCSLSQMLNVSNEVFRKIFSTLSSINSGIVIQTLRLLQTCNIIRVITEDTSLQAEAFLSLSTIRLSFLKNNDIDILTKELRNKLFIDTKSSKRSSDIIKTGNEHRIKDKKMSIDCVPSSNFSTLRNSVSDNNEASTSERVHKNFNITGVIKFMKRISRNTNKSK